MGYSGWKPYVSVARKREQAHRAALKAKKSGKDLSPIVLATRGAIAKTFWGKAWCTNLEAYSDFENRLPRGRSYVRNGSVIDLKIEPGKVIAKVMGSRLYRIEIGIAALPASQWQAIVQASAGSIASLVELLQGKLSQSWSGFASPGRDCSRRRRKFSLTAPARTGPRCASMWPPCSTALGRGWMKGRSFCSPCVRSMRAIW